LAAWMGWKGATQATGPPPAASFSQSTRASSEPSVDGTVRTTPAPSSGATPSRPSATAYNRWETGEAGDGVACEASAAARTRERASQGPRAEFSVKGTRTARAVDAA